MIKISSPENSVSSFEYRCSRIMIDLDGIAISGKFARNDQTLDPPAVIIKKKELGISRECQSNEN